MTWSEICDHRSLRDIPFRVESDRWGNAVLIPLAPSSHSELIGVITNLLWNHLQGGALFTICPVTTSEGVKTIDVAWISNNRKGAKPYDPAFVIAPEICVEILSPSNTSAEIEFRKKLFFEKGAVEFWVCDENGELTFYDAAGQIPQSKLCAQFPSHVEV